jgi:DNA polymerase III delta prime subunit
MEAIHSRCSVIEFKLQNGQKAKMAAQFFKRVEWLLTEEGVTYDKSVVAAVITKHFPDNRRILNELQRYSSNEGKTIDKGILAVVSDVNITELVKALKAKDFTTARKWVTNNLDSDTATILRKIYDNMYEFLKPESIPPAVLVLSKYQYQAAFVADQEINLVACLTEFMIECEFK